MKKLLVSPMSASCRRVSAAITCATLGESFDGFPDRNPILNEFAFRVVRSFRSRDLLMLWWDASFNNFSPKSLVGVRQTMFEKMFEKMCALRGLKQKLKSND
jgi:hypothetical protein